MVSMSASKYKQMGMGMPAWGAVALIGCLLILCAVKMIPAYISHMYVKEALQFVIEQNDDIAGATKDQLKGQISRYDIINNIGSVQMNSFRYDRVKNRMVVSSIYEVRETIFANVDVVMSFKAQLDTADPDACCKYLIDVTNEPGKN